MRLQCQYVASVYIGVVLCFQVPCCSCVASVWPFITESCSNSSHAPITNWLERVQIHHQLTAVPTTPLFSISQYVFQQYVSFSFIHERNLHPLSLLTLLCSPHPWVSRTGSVTRDNSGGVQQRLKTCLTLCWECGHGFYLGYKRIGWLIAMTLVPCTPAVTLTGIHGAHNCQPSSTKST